jgi:hypothetical protein
MGQPTTDDIQRRGWQRVDRTRIRVDGLRHWRTVRTESTNENARERDCLNQSHGHRYASGQPHMKEETREPKWLDSH